MSNSMEIKLVYGRPNRGRLPVSVMRGDDVLLTGKVDPHKPDEVEALVERICSDLPGLQATKHELRQEVLNLAKSKERSGPRPPRSADEHPYSEYMGGIHWCRMMGDSEVLVPLTNFTAKIVGNVLRDDGTESESVFEIEGTLRERPYRLTLPASRFNGMNWPTEHLGAEAIVHPGQSIRDHARAAIQFLSPKPIPRHTIFTHTGWRKLEGEAGVGGGWAYLHGGGAIGASGKVDGVRVDLPVALSLYELAEPPSGEELKAAIRASLGILELAADAITFPVFCAIWRVALGPCDFGLHLAGASGVFKSELAALTQQHFGARLDARHLPGSWQSTDNSLEGLLFAAKDSVTVIDDFAPCGSRNEVARWHQRADRIFRAQGNSAGRGRMRADGSLRPPKPPRGLVLSTGEDIPKGQSLRARIIILEISNGDIAANRLTRCQKDARSGLYTAALAGFVRSLAGRYEQVSQRLRADVEALRQEASGGDAHCRTPEIVANLAVGLRYWITFAQEAGVVTEAEGEQLWRRGWAALIQAGAKQGDHQGANEPAGRFVELLSSAIASGMAHLADRDGKAPENPGAWGWRADTVGTGSYARDEWRPQGDRIGWIDAGDMLLDSDASFRVAQGMAGSNGDGLVITARTLRKRMDEKGMVIRQTPGELLSRRVLEGRSRNVLHLAAGALCMESRKSHIPHGHRDSKSTSEDKCRIPVGESRPTLPEIPHDNPALALPESSKTDPVTGNVGNAGKCPGDTPAWNVTNATGAVRRQWGSV